MTTKVHQIQPNFTFPEKPPVVSDPTSHATLSASPSAANLDLSTGLCSPGADTVFQPAPNNDLLSNLAGDLTALKLSQQHPATSHQYSGSFGPSSYSTSALYDSATSNALPSAHPEVIPPPLQQRHSFQQQSHSDTTPIADIFRSIPGTSHPSPVIPSRPSYLLSSPPLSHMHSGSTSYSHSRSCSQTLQPQQSQSQIPRSARPGNQRTPFNRAFSNGPPIRTSSPLEHPKAPSLETIIQLDVQLTVAKKTAQDAASRLASLILRHNIFNRLQASLHTFYVSMARASALEPNKFATPYIQSLDLASSLLKNETFNKQQGFMSALKASNRGLLNSFITLIKTSPSFFCACISTMNDVAIDGLFENSPVDSTISDLALLHRSNALDIIFFSFFSPLSSPKQRSDYFSFILAFAFENDKNIKYHKLIIAILDRIISSEKHDYSGIEELLFGMLQDGQFLLSKKAQNASYAFPSAQPEPQSPSQLHPPSFSRSQASTTPVTTTFPCSVSPATTSTSMSHVFATPISTPLASTPNSMFSFLPSTSSAPTSTYSSPELPAISSPALATPTFSTRVSPAASSLQRLNASYPKGDGIAKRSSSFPSQADADTHSEIEQMSKKFITTYITKILTHLNNTANEKMPKDFQAFVSLTLSKVSEPYKDKALKFIFYQYFISKHVHEIIVYPESAGLLHDFFISAKQRQRILTVVFQHFQLYTEVVLLDPLGATDSLHTPHSIQSQILLLYDHFKSLISAPVFPKSDDPTDHPISAVPSAPESPLSTTSANFDLEESFINYPFEGGSFTGQLVILSPGDVYTLYTSLLYSFFSQNKPDPMNLDRSRSSLNNLFANSSSSCLVGSAPLDSTPSFYIHGSTGGSAVTLPAIHVNAGLTCLEEMGGHLKEDDSDDDNATTSSFDDSAFEWNLQDIKIDIEPAAEELLSKFPYLQSRSASVSNIHHSGAQKTSPPRLPHPFSENWQIFRVGDDNTITDVDDNSIAGPSSPSSYDFLDHPVKFLDDTTNPDFEDLGIFSFLEFEKSPIPPGNRVCIELVLKSLRSVISENSSVVFSPKKHEPHGKKSQTNNDDMEDFTHHTETNPNLSFSTSLFNLGGNSNSSFALPSSSLSSPWESKFQQSQWYGDFSKISVTPSINWSMSHLHPQSPQYLVQFLIEAGNKSTSLRDYVQACEYFNASQALLKLYAAVASTLLFPNAYSHAVQDVNYYILRLLKKSKEKALDIISAVINRHDDLGGPYHIFLQQKLNISDFYLHNLNDLRVKIWYATEIRTTPLWARAKDVATILRKGSAGDSAELEDDEDNGDVLQTSRQNTLKRNSSSTSLSSAAAYTFKRLTYSSSSSTPKRGEYNKRHSLGHSNSGSSSSSSLTASLSMPALHLDTLFAPSDLSCPKKLNDKESDATEKWLEDKQIQNFCTGEEIIHRFSYEVDELVKRVIGDALSNHPSKCQSYLTPSLLFRADLWKSILEFEGLDRAAVPSVPSKKNHTSSSSIVGSGGFLGFGSGGFFGHSSSSAAGAKNDLMDQDLKRRGSMESFPFDSYRMSHHSRGKNTSAQSEMKRSYSLRGHRSLKSSPNLSEVFTSSLDSTVSNAKQEELSFDNGLGINRPHSSAGAGRPLAPPEKKLGHRRNKSLNEEVYGNTHASSSTFSLSSSSDRISEESPGLYKHPSTSFPHSLNMMGSAPSSSSSQTASTALPQHGKSGSSSSISLHSNSPFLDEPSKNRHHRHYSNLEENSQLKEAYKQMVLTIQMRLISLIYTDLGIESWSQGSETDKWITSPIVSKAIKINDSMQHSESGDINATITGIKKDATEPEKASFSNDTASLQEIDLHKFFSSPVESGPPLTSAQFPYDEAYGNLLYRASVSPSPMTKLMAFYELEKLVVLSLQMQSFNNVNVFQPSSYNSFTTNPINNAMPSFSRVASTGPPSITGSEINTPLLTATPRTSYNSGISTPLSSALLTALPPSAMTPNGQVSTDSIHGTPNLSASRRGSSPASALPPPDSILSSMASLAGAAYPSSVMHSLDAHPSSLLTATAPSVATAATQAGAAANAAVAAAAEAAIGMIPNTDEIAEELRRIFKSHGKHARTLFRDLQLIATFVPSNILDLTDMGKAFWDVSLAALSLKEEYLDTVVSTASDIFKHCTEPGNFIPPDVSFSHAVKYKQFIAPYTLKDAVELWTIAAKEGDINGERELAIMYMSHPYSIASVGFALAPFTRTNDVFSPQILQDLKRSSGSFYADKEALMKRADPVRMAVIRHWMSKAALLGDGVANEFMAQHQHDLFSYGK